MTEGAWGAADRDIIVGEALVPGLEGVTMERWVPQEAPAPRGTERECMAFLCDDLATRFAERIQSLAPGKQPSSASSGRPGSGRGPLDR